MFSLSASLMEAHAHYWFNDKPWSVIWLMMWNIEYALNGDIQLKEKYKKSRRKKILMKD